MPSKGAASIETIYYNQRHQLRRLKRIDTLPAPLGMICDCQYCTWQEGSPQLLNLAAVDIDVPIAEEMNPFHWVCGAIQHIAIGGKHLGKHRFGSQCPRGKHQVLTSSVYL